MFKNGFVCTHITDRRPHSTIYRRGPNLSGCRCSYLEQFIPLRHLGNLDACLSVKSQDSPRSTQPSIPPGLANRVTAYWLGLRRGAFTCVGWQVKMCDPIWQVTYRRDCEIGVSLTAMRRFTFLPLYYFLSQPLTMTSARAVTPCHFGHFNRSCYLLTYLLTYCAMSGFVTEME